MDAEVHSTRTLARKFTGQMMVCNGMPWLQQLQARAVWDGHVVAVRASRLLMLLLSCILQSMYRPLPHASRLFWPLSDAPPASTTPRGASHGLQMFIDFRLLHTPGPAARRGLSSCRSLACS